MERRSLPRQNRCFWGAIGYRGQRSELVALDGDLLSKKNGVIGRTIRILYKRHLPKIVRRGTFFQQNNAPVHTAKIVAGWLHEWLEEIHVEAVSWPPYSSDLNPIENIWKVMKDHIIVHSPAKSLNHAGFSCHLRFTNTDC